MRLKDSLSDYTPQTEAHRSKDEIAPCGGCCCDFAKRWCMGNDAAEYGSLQG